MIRWFVCVGGILLLGLFGALFASNANLPISKANALAAAPAAVLPVYASSSPIGTLAPTFSVNGNGSATASIPIEVPPGAKGVAPNLSISYDSHRNNGYLGMGWAINGMSAISRCSANYRLDDYKASVAYTARDRFCLDGRRLVVVSGTYGADGTIYHTEMETWTLLTSHGSCGAGPCSFSATDKDGHTLSFGDTTGASGSRIVAASRSDGAVRTWAIDSFTDLNGNTTLATYTSDITSGEYYPAQISYTQNTAAGLNANRFVTFNYGARADISEKYLGGSKVSVTKLLTSIETSLTVNGNSQTILTYKLSYSASPATQRSRLDNVQQCDSQNICLPATTFAWSTDSQTFSPSTSNLPGPSYIISNGKQYLYGVLKDFNGDGIADYSPAAEFIVSSTPQSDLKIYLGQPDGGFKQASYDLPDAIVRVSSGSVVQTGILIDINGDGILDYSRALKNDDNGTQDLNVYIGSQTGFALNSTYTLPGPMFWQVGNVTYPTGILRDMNGDGLVDYSRATKLLSTGQEMLSIFKGTSGGFKQTPANLPGPVYSISSSTGALTTGMVRDINGDGVADYSAALVNADASTSDLKVYVGQTPDFTFTHEFDLPGQMFWLVNGRTLDTGILTDVNGDGIADYSRATKLLSTGAYLLDLYFGTGKGFVKASFDMPKAIYVVDNNSSQIQGMMTDWNGDGTRRFSKATKYQDGTTDYDIFLANGTGFSSSKLKVPDALFTVANGQTYAGATYQDINADGLTDFAQSVCQLNNGSLSSCDLSVHLAAGPYTDLLTGITNGFLGTTAIDYAPLTSAGLYTSGTAPVYPLRSQQGSVQVVSAYTISDGRSDSYQYKYTYSGGKTDLIGSGWIGFETVSMIQAADNRVSEVTYNQAYPNYGQVKASRVIDGTSNILTASNFTYTDVASSSMQALGIHQILRTEEDITHYATNTAEYTLKKQYAYDGYGNILITSDLGDVSTPSDDFFTCSRYENDDANGRFGYWLQQKTTSTLASCQSFVAATSPSAVVWNPATDLRWNQQTYTVNMDVSTIGAYDNTHTSFQSMGFTYNEIGNILTQTDLAGNIKTFAYDAGFQTYQTQSTSPMLTRGTQSYQLVTQMVHEPGFGMLIETTDPNGNVTSQSIDGFGRVVSVYGPDPAGTKVQMLATTWQNQSGAYYLLSQQRPSWDNTVTSTWPWRKDYQDGMGRNYQNVRNGQKAGVSKDIILSSFLYDAEGRIYQASDPYFEGDTPPYTATIYDAYNRPTKITGPDNVVTQRTYQKGGLQITTVAGYGTTEARTSVKTIDSRGRATQTIDPNNRTINYVYNPIGEMLGEDIVGAALTSSFTYDSRGRSLTAHHPDSGTVTRSYTNAGYLKSVTNASGSNAAYGPYDPLGRLVSRVMTDDSSAKVTVAIEYDGAAVSNGLGHVTGVNENQPAAGAFSYVYSYNAYGEVTEGQLTVGGDQYAYASSYDPMGRIVTSTYPNGASLTQAYFDTDNLSTISFKDNPAASSVDYAAYEDYTALGQHQLASYEPVNVALSKQYNPVGPGYAKLATYQAKTKAGVTLLDNGYGWDNFSDLLSVTDKKTASHSASYGYEAQASNKGMGYLTNADGAFGSKTYDYDTIGNLQSSKNNAATVTYSYTTATNQMKASSAGDTYTYDANGNMINAKTSAGQSKTYTYDANGLLTAIDDGGVSSAQMVYNHAGHRLYHRGLDSDVETWTITPFYEVTKLSGGTFQNTIYIPGKDGIVATITEAGKNNTYTMSGAAFGTGSFNPKGGGLSKTITILFALTALAIFVARTASTRRGTAKLKLEPATLRTYWQVIKSASVSALLIIHAPLATAQMIPGGNGAGVPTSGTQFYIHDHLGSVSLVLDASANISAQISYDVFGGLNQQASSGTDNFRSKFVDRELDASANLYFMGSRYYAPDMMRFISPDSQNQFASPYLYAGNNPASATDPNGEFAFLTAMVIGIIIGAVVGAEFGGAAVNHDMNPLHWNWKSGKTYGGIFAGAAIGAIGAAAGGEVVEAGVAIGASGGLAAEAAGVAAGIAGQAVIGAGENAAFTALGGGSAKDILESAGQGAAFGAAFEAGGQALSQIGSRLSREVSAEASDEVSAGLRKGKKGAAEEPEAGGRSGSCSLRQSFPAGTPVTLDDGTLASIETIAKDDFLTGFDTGTKTTGSYLVADTFSRQVDTLIELQLADNTSIETTPEHAFWTQPQGWVAANKLSVDDRLMTVSGDDVTIKEIVNNESKAKTVYNFEIADVHNYFAGYAQILVHNGKFCRAEVDSKTGIVTEYWKDSELRNKFPISKHFNDAKRDIRFKARRANWAIAKKGIKPFTRVKNPVKTASLSWVKAQYKLKYPSLASPTSVRVGLQKLRPHFYKQDVDEFLTRIQGGLTIREGAGWNQGPLNSWVNSTHGATMGALSRSGKPVAITRFVVKYE